MNPQNEGLLTPNLVPVENKLILPPGTSSGSCHIEGPHDHDGIPFEAPERERVLAAIEAEEAERADEEEEELPLSARCKHGVCKNCGHSKLVFLPAKLCEKCLRKAAEAAGVPFPERGQVVLNRAERRRLKRGR